MDKVRFRVSSLLSWTPKRSSDLNPIIPGGPLYPILTILTVTFQTYYDLDIKSKFVSLTSRILKISSDLNPNSHGGPVLANQLSGQVFSWPNVTMISSGKLLLYQLDLKNIYKQEPY